jgi:hypothetical protein
MSRTVVIGIGSVVAVFIASIYLMILVKQPTTVSRDAAAAVTVPGTSSPTRASQVSTNPVPATAAPPASTHNLSPATASLAVEEEDPPMPKIDVMALPESDPRLTTTAAFDEANRAYDASDYDQAKTIALKLLGKNPGNVRLMRIVVSSACMMGDASSTVADLYKKLPSADQTQMKTRCERFGISFN